MIINNLVETHCHILPGIDDGSKDVETSLKMIERLQSQGVTKIVLTPHYYSDNISLDDFLRKRDKSFNTLMRALPPGSPELIPAAEVYISKYLMNNESLDELKIGNSEYILIEHSFSSDFSDDEIDRLANLYYDYHARPVLAHIERYKSLMDKKYKLDDLISMGCLAQVNISSFAEASRFTKKKLFKFLEGGKIHFIGSDAHNLTSRPPEYRDGIKEIEKKCGKSAVLKLVENANILVE